MIWFATCVLVLSLAGCGDDSSPAVEKTSLGSQPTTTIPTGPSVSTSPTTTSSTSSVKQPVPPDYRTGVQAVVAVIQVHSEGERLGDDISFAFFDGASNEDKIIQVDRSGVIEAVPGVAGLWSGWDVVGERSDQEITTTDVLVGFELYSVLQNGHGITGVLTEDGRDAVAGKRVLNVEFANGGRVFFAELEDGDVNETHRLTATTNRDVGTEVLWSRRFESPITFSAVLDPEGRHLLVGVSDQAVASNPLAAELHVVDGRTGETLESMTSPDGLRAVWTPADSCDAPTQLRPGGQFWDVGTTTHALYECDKGRVVSFVRGAGLPEVFFAIDSNGNGADEVFVGGTFGHGHGSDGYTRVGDDLLPIMDEAGSHFGLELGNWDERWISNYGCIDGQIGKVDITYSDTAVTSSARLYRMEGARAVLIGTLPDEVGAIDDYLDGEGRGTIDFPLSELLAPIVECTRAPTPVETNFVLRPDGIGAAGFGDDPVEVIAWLAELAGDPASDRGWGPSCIGERPRRSVIWELEDGGRDSRLWVEIVADEIDWNGNLTADDSQIVNPQFIAYSYGYHNYSSPTEFFAPSMFGIEGGVALETALDELEAQLGEITLIRGNDVVHQYWLSDDFGGDVWPNNPAADQSVTAIRAGENREGIPC